MGIVSTCLSTQREIKHTFWAYKRLPDKDHIISDHQKPLPYTNMGELRRIGQLFYWKSRKLGGADADRS